MKKFWPIRQNNSENKTHNKHFSGQAAECGAEAVEKGQEVFSTRNWSINEPKIAPILKTKSTHHRNTPRFYVGAPSKKGSRVFLQPRYCANPE